MELSIRLIKKMRRKKGKLVKNNLCIGKVHLHSKTKPTYLRNKLCAARKLYTHIKNAKIPKPTYMATKLYTQIKNAKIPILFQSNMFGCCVSVSVSPFF